MIEFDNISKKYNDVSVIKNLSGKIEKGKCTAVIGPSGSGKSTLIRILSLLEYPDSGTYRLDNSIEQIFPTSNKIHNSLIWPTISVVFQQLYLWPHLSLIDNIRTVLLANDKYKPSTILELNELLDYFDLKELELRFPNQLSIGQRQMVALIRALILEPDYLFLDEITASLDVEHIKKVKEVIEIQKSKGMGVLFATHLLGFASSLANSIWFIDNGELIETGSTEILTNPKTKRFKEFLSLN